MSFYVYLLSNDQTKPIYVGVTNNLQRRLYEHKNSIKTNSYTSNYKLFKLLYWEELPDPISAINREKQIKHWKYEWKKDLIKTSNPKFEDLSVTLGF